MCLTTVTTPMVFSSLKQSSLRVMINAACGFFSAARYRCLGRLLENVALANWKITTVMSLMSAARAASAYTYN